MKEEDLAQAIVEAIEDDLRQCLGGIWQQIDPDTRRSILTRWLEIVRQKLGRD